MRKIDRSQLPQFAALTRPGAPPSARGRPLPAVVVAAARTHHGSAIHVQLAVSTDDESHPWALIEDDLRVQHSRTVARLRRVLDLAEDEAVTPEQVLGAQVEVVLGTAADGSARVRGYRPLFGAAPKPPHLALELEPGARATFGGLIDDVEVEGSTLVLRLALDAPGEDLGAEPVCLVRRVLRTRDARVAGHELMVDGDWAFDPRALVGARVRVSCTVESYGAAYAPYVVVGAIEPAL